MEMKAKPRTKSAGSDTRKDSSAIIKESDEEIQSMKKWVEVIEGLSTYLTKKRSVFIKLVRKGIPDYFRGHVWKSFMQPAERKKSPHFYSDVIKLTADKNKFVDPIAKDVMRLKPIKICPQVECSQWSKKITNILTAIAYRFPEIGYVQGMAMIACVCLAYMDDEDAFWFFADLIEHHGLREVYMSDFPGLKKAFYVHLRLLKEHFPKVFSHFGAVGIRPSMYCANWFMTLYSGCWPIHLVARIWDVYFCEGPEIIQRVALTVIKFYQPQFSTLPFEGILKLTRTMWDAETAEKLLQTALSMASIDKEIQMFDEERTRSPDPVIIELCQ